MSESANTIASEFAAYFKNIATKLNKRVNPLPTSNSGGNPYSYGNSIGHLLLHLTGNVNYYIGAQIAATSYVRNRDREFTEANRPSKEEVLRRFDDAIKLVVETIYKQSPENWNAAYPAERSKAKNRFAIVLSCAAHADHH